ncbi:GntR family transcriptional regulator [Anaerococcus sp. Marseille-Q7828]|uniref:GntR family transcriptional regulator n=1 Tax=Anaerococcus sp. Marseille-Q7828 TaxID=3036300 RepID=UPI0024AE5514|nr:GntR family transcriptional regulator [Anaerococcus sp. Marseille-Q7828]
MRLKDKVYLYIEELISNGKLKSGDPIVETVFAERLHVSRTPVREALKDLENDGFVISYPGKGTFVRQITTKDIENIYDVRSSLEVLALEKSFDSLDEYILLNLKEKYINLEKNFSWEIARKLDEDFHNYFINKANNETLSEILIKLNKQVSVYRTIASKDPNRSEKTINEHMKIIEAISRKDKDLAIEALKIHLDSVKKSAIEASLM